MLTASQNIIHTKLLIYYALCSNVECVTLPLCCHLERVGLSIAIIFLHVNFWPFSFFTRTACAKINPDCHACYQIPPVSTQQICRSLRQDVTNKSEFGRIPKIVQGLGRFSCAWNVPYDWLLKYTTGGRLEVDLEKLNDWRRLHV